MFDIMHPIHPRPRAHSYHPVGRRVSIGDEAPTRKNKDNKAAAATTLGLLGLRSVAAHRLRSYSAECSSRLSPVAGV